MNDNFEIVISAFFSGKTLREFFEFFHVARSKIYKIFLEERVRINQKIESERYVLKREDHLSIHLDGIEKIDFPPTAHSLRVVYEDDFCLILDKPSGVLIHPDGKENRETLVNYVSYYYQGKGLNRMIRYPHRLDFETTGLILFAKIFFFQSYLDHLLSVDQLERVYHLLACNSFKESQGDISLKLLQDKKLRRMRVSSYGIEAKTHYRVIQSFDQFALVEAILETGRMHQIRAHFEAIGHPLIGDFLYNTKIVADRVMLHSKKMGFFHPFLEKNLQVEIEYPEDFRRFLC